jgi:hypothetical protein
MCGCSICTQASGSRTTFKFEIQEQEPLVEHLVCAMPVHMFQWTQHPELLCLGGGSGQERPAGCVSGQGLEGP